MLNGATTAAAIADRIDAIVFQGEMPRLDKSALVTCLRPDPPTTTRIATRSDLRWRRRRFSGINPHPRSGGAAPRLTTGGPKGHRCSEENWLISWFNTKPIGARANTTSCRGASSWRGPRRPPSR
jgi:hypothetical protein